jgi:transposase
MGRRGHSPEFKRRVLDLLEAGRKVTDVARDLGISSQAISNWRRQDRIDRGLEPGLSSIQHQELLAARRRIAELETELKIARQAVQLLKDVKPQKCGTRLSRAWPPRTFRLKLPVGCLTCPAPASTHGGTALLRKVRSATPRHPTS